MANFLAVFDTNPGRRNLFLARARGRLPLHEKVVSGEASKGDFVILWGCAAATPIDRHRDSETLTVRFGQSVDDQSGLELKAADLPSCPFGAHDGYHAWISYSSRTGVRASTDFLGAFPLYFWVGEDRDVLCTAPDPAHLADIEAELNARFHRQSDPVCKRPLPS